MRESAADRALIDELAAVGVRVSARQLERWRAYGLLRTERHGLGRGRGSTSCYALDSAHVVERLLGALEGRRQFDLAVLALLSDGVELPEEALRRAYRNLFSRLADATRRPGETTDAAAVRLERGLLREAQGRAWRRQLRQAGHGDDAFRRTLAAVIRLALDEQLPDADELSLILEASGLASVARRVAMAHPEIEWGETAHLLDLFKLPRLAAAVERASLADLNEGLARAAPMLALVAPAATVFAGILGFADGRRLFRINQAGAGALVVPVMLVLAEIEDVDAASARASEWQPFFNALAGVLNALPFWYGRLFANDGLERLGLLSDARRDHVLKRVRQAVVANQTALDVLIHEQRAEPTERRE